MQKKKKNPWAWIHNSRARIMNLRARFINPARRCLNQECRFTLGCLFLPSADPGAGGAPYHLPKLSINPFCCASWGAPRNAKSN